MLFLYSISLTEELVSSNVASPRAPVFYVPLITFQIRKYYMFTAQLDTTQVIVRGPCIHGGLVTQ